MTCAERLRAYLSEHGVSYEVTQHPLAYTAQELAAAEHVPGRLVAKSVMLQADGKLVMIVLPATEQVDLDKVKASLGSKKVRLAKEEEFAGAFPDCEVGAEPPFGNLYGVPVYMDKSLAADPYIVFRDGSHTETLKIATEDYLRLVRPVEVDVAART